MIDLLKSGKHIAYLLWPLALVLSILPVTNLPLAWLGIWLAQPAFALAWRYWRQAKVNAMLGRDAIVLGIIWAAGYSALALSIAWPISALRDTGSLSSSLGLSLVLGLAWLVLWRKWPVYARATRVGGTLANVTSAPAGSAVVNRGLGLAAAILSVLIIGLLCVWPGLWPAPSWALLLLNAAVSAVLPEVLIRFGREPESSQLPSFLKTGQDNTNSTSINAVIAIDAELPVSTDVELAQAPSSPVKLQIDPSDTAALYQAARAGNVDAAIAALRAGADPYAEPEPEDIDQRALPILAALLPDLRLLRELIGRGVDVNTERNGLTPLLAATRDSWHGRSDAVMTLLANGADPRMVDHDGNTPLHHAARSTDPAVAALLLDAAAPLNALNNEGLSPLSMACESGNWRLAKLLLDRGAQIEPENGQSALLAAARHEEDDLAGVELLIKHKLKIDARGPANRTALHEAISRGHARITTELLRAGASLLMTDNQGLDAFLEAACAPSDAVLESVLSYSPDINTRDVAGRNAIARACDAMVSPARLRRLINAGVDIEQRDLQGRRPLEHALGAGRWPLVAVLDPDYPLPIGIAEQMEGRRDLRTPRERLREALIAQDFALADRIIDDEDAPSALAQSTLLLEFADDSGAVAFDWLLAHGADPDARPSAMDSVSLLLIDRGMSAYRSLQKLLDGGKTPTGAGGLSRWLSVASHLSNDNAERFTLRMLESGLDPFGISAERDPPLIQALRLGWKTLFSRLLDSGADPNSYDRRGRTALHHAAEHGQIDIIQQLLHAGASPVARAPDGQTPLGLALANGQSQAAAWLEWTDWNFPRRALIPADLPAAAMAGDLNALQRLLALGLPINAIDAQGCTALLRASGGGHLALVEHLLAFGAESKISARSGATALSAAISMRHIAIVDRLLKARADVEQPLPGGITPLMLAAALGLPELCARLLSYGALIEARDDQSNTPLHFAAQHAFQSRDRSRSLALFDTLLFADALPDVVNDARQTPLLMLLGARAEPGSGCDEELILTCLDRLLSEGVNLASADERGLTALHLAATHGLSRVLRRLLRDGADSKARDIMGRSPHDLALIRGFVDVAAEFDTRAGASPSMARFLRDPSKG